jgi:hypothetical protein
MEKSLMQVSTWLKEDLENEILGYGWVKAVGKLYFIDMELADLSLADYIEYSFSCYLS